MLSLFGRRREEERLDDQLSAYLDGELSDRERERLETRLSQEPALRAQLREMRHTVSLMRELPQVAAPRHFILSESMVRRETPVPEVQGARRQPRRALGAWAAPLLTGAATVVSLLFVVVLVGDLLLPAAGRSASAPAPMLQQEEAPRLALEAASTPSSEEEELGAADLAATPPAPAETKANEAVEQPEMAAEEELSEAERAAEPLPDAGATSVPAEGGGPTEEAAALVVPTVVPTATSMVAVTPTIPAEAPVVSEGELGLVEPPPADVDVSPEPLRAEREPSGLLLPHLPWRALEVALGLASLLLTFATVKAWQVRRR